MNRAEKERRVAPKGWRHLVVGGMTYTWRVTKSEIRVGWLTHYAVTVARTIPAKKIVLPKVKLELAYLIDDALSPQEVAAIVKLLLSEGWDPMTDYQATPVRRMVDPALDIDTDKSRAFRRLAEVSSVMET